MKKILSLFVFVCFSVIVFGQYNQPSEDFYQRKIQKFEKMKNTGTGLIIGGSVATIAGIYTFSKLEFQERTDAFGQPYYEIQDKGKFLFSYMGVVLGITAFSGGVVLNRIGNSKVNKYSRKMKNLSFAPYYNGEQSGLCLVYKF